MGYVLKLLPDSIALLLLYFFVFYRRWKARGLDALVVRTLFYIYLCAVLYFTLMPVITELPALFNHPYAPMNLTLFDDYTHGRGDAVRQILLNVLMMVPFGFLLPHLKKRGLGSVLGYTFLFSLAIELIQPLFSRSSDITDLLTNVMGGLIGYLIYLVLRPITQKGLFRLRPKEKAPSKT